MAREPRLKLAAMSGSTLVVVSATVFGVPDLSGIADAAVCLVSGAAAMVWALVRAGREDGFRSFGATLAHLSRTDRRVVKDGRRHPSRVPEHLTPVAADHARRQADGNDRSGWVMTALILINASSIGAGGRVIAFTSLLAIFLVLGLGSDFLGVRWRRTAVDMQQRVRMRARVQHDAQRRGLDVT